MVALVPAGADELTVTGGDSAADLHLTLAYLGDDVTERDDRQRTPCAAMPYPGRRRPRRCRPR